MDNQEKIFVVTPNPQSLHPTTLFNGESLGQSVQRSVVNSNYCAVINVSDSPCATFDYQGIIPSFWFPIHEHADWGYTPFFGALKVVNRYYKKGGKPVLIHCHAGANRSPSVAFAMVIAKEMTVEEIETSLNYPDLSLVFQRNIELGHIPKDIIGFLKYSDSQEGKLDALHYVLSNMDADYKQWAENRMGRIKDAVVHSPLKNEAIRVVYSPEKRQFIRKETINKNY